jgi:hypothetical protein
MLVLEAGYSEFNRKNLLYYTLPKSDRTCIRSKFLDVGLEPVVVLVVLSHLLASSISSQVLQRLVIVLNSLLCAICCVILPYVYTCALYIIRYAS